MPRDPIVLNPKSPLTVGSIGDPAGMRSVTAEEAVASCDVVEIRLDLIAHDPELLESTPWRRFRGLPLLFTARRGSEGGAGDLDASARMALLRTALEDAALVDIEVASIPEMQPLIAELAERGVPWLGSSHDFSRTPPVADLAARRMAARNAGAACFKAAVELHWETDQLGQLAHFLRQSGDHPVSLMGMGPLAPVSRVLFAQLGSVLNYGYLGSTATAPGQWSARQLKEAIAAAAKP